MCNRLLGDLWFRLLKCLSAILFVLKIINCTPLNQSASSNFVMQIINQVITASFSYGKV